jgi:Flp pilus assembly protein TadG
VNTMSLGSNTPGNRMKAMQSSTFLSRLRRDQKGNALAMVAASIIPLVGAIGGGVDLTRAYMAEARLAQACDAAALAGRKVLVDGDTDDSGNVAWNSKAGQEIQRFLNYNFPAGKFGSQPIERTANVNEEGALTVTLSTAVDTSLLRIASIDDIPIDATCSARRSGVNVDVVMVLDVTGSMAGSRIAELKTGTLSFLGTLDTLRAQLASGGTRVRVGIVPYSTTVNVGLDLLADGDYIEMNAAKYYSRAKVPYQSGTKWYNRSYDVGKTSLDLTKFVERGRDSGFVNSYNWKGCVEMRRTVRTIGSTTPLDSIPADAWDIRDVAPGVDGAPKWQPYILLPGPESDAQYAPPSSGAASSDTVFKKIAAESDIYSRVPYNIVSDQSGPTTTPTSQTTGLGVTAKAPNNGCNSRVKLLAESSKDDLSAYVNALTTDGNTYHDVGMYWGLALISPQAPFENPSTYLADGFTGEARGVNRYIVFMTDGQIQPTENYTAWGREKYPSDADNHTITSSGNLVDSHRRRFRLICEEAKRTGVEVFTVAYSSGVGASDEDSLKKCASSDEHYFKVSTGGLESAFQKIAQSIGYLRISK